MVWPLIEAIPASMAGLPATRAMVSVGPPLSARPLARPGELTPVKLPLLLLTSVPAPPVPIRLSG